MEKLALRHQLKNQSECNRRWLLGTSRQMMDDFLLKWQLCCVSAILIQNKCTGRLSWLFNSYHCGKWISNLWRAISGWQGTYGLFFSFSFPSLFFFSFSFLQTWGKILTEVPQTFTSGSQGTKSRTVQSLLQWWEPTWEGRAGGPEPPSSFHHCPCPEVPWKFKKVFIY